MESPRGVRMFKRNDSTRSTISSCSSLAMEIKRKKRRAGVLAQNEDCTLQEMIDFEMRMRAGAYKLVMASTKKEQILDAAKSLLTCNTRIKAYMAEAQRIKEEQDVPERLSSRTSVSEYGAPCNGKIAITGLRLPLFWKDSEHFNTKGNSQRVAVFCLMKIGFEIFDTEMVIVDRTVTDICFEGVTIFSEAKPDFELAVELYSCAVEEEVTLVNTPKKLARKLRSSLGKVSGRKLCPLLDGGEPDAFLQSNPIPCGAKYSLLAHATLGLEQTGKSFQSHSLIVLKDMEASSWLPLYGNLCCQLVAQPDCMTQDVMSGYLIQQQSIEGLQHCCRLYCVLKAGLLSCYFTSEEIQAKIEPNAIIPINKDTRLRVVEGNPKEGARLSITNPGTRDPASQVFMAETLDLLQNWLNALLKHLYDQSQWKHACDKLMEIEGLSLRKPPLFLTKQADSVYNDLSIGSPGKFESLTDMIHNKIEETDGHFLIDQEENHEPPHWAALFEGSQPMLVHKTVLSPETDSSQFMSSPGLSSSSKKRRAPPPPPDKLPFAHPPVHWSCPPSYQEKENSDKGIRSRTGRPSLDAKFSAIIQQLQKSHATSRKNPPLAQVEPSQKLYISTVKMEKEHTLSEHAEKLTSQPSQPAPRNKLRKSFREKINPKAYL